MLRKRPNKLQFSIPFPADAGPYADRCFVRMSGREGQGGQGRSPSKRSHKKLVFPWVQGEELRILWGRRELPFASGRWLTRGKILGDVDSEPM